MLTDATEVTPVPKVMRPRAQETREVTVNRLPLVYTTQMRIHL
jgi:hypothetical protein